MQFFAVFTSVLLRIAAKYKTTLTPWHIFQCQISSSIQKKKKEKNSDFPLEGIGKWNLNAVTLVQGPFLSILMEPDKWMLWGKF